MSYWTSWSAFGDVAANIMRNCATCLQHVYQPVYKLVVPNIDDDMCYAFRCEACKSLQYYSMSVHIEELE